MRVEFKKKQDGVTILRYVRNDGTATWQKDTRGFFPFHDLTHYAIETVLELRFAFYGILESGWDIDDFGTPWPKGHMRPEWETDAALAEGLAGRFDLERATGATVTAEEFNAYFANVCVENGLKSPRVITDDDLTRIRARCQTLFTDLRALQPGETLTLPFPIPSGADKFR